MNANSFLTMSYRTGTISQYSTSFMPRMFILTEPQAMEMGFGIKHDLTGDKFKVRIEAFQFFHNEYTKTPILFDSKVCDVLEQNLFGMKNLLEPHGNLTKCPLKKGVYLVRGFNLEATTFPPHVPRGRWRLNVYPILGEAWITTLSWFGSVEDIIKY